MQLPSGLFCFERARGDDEPHGQSLRYTLMTCLGLARARKAGYKHEFHSKGIYEAAARELSASELVPGDLGLYLWADARVGGGRQDELTALLRQKLSERGGFAALEGMELGWILQGLAVQRDLSNGDAGMLRQAVDFLLERNQASSGLFYHHGTRGLRRRFPNFATEIYSILALATVGRLARDERALPAARQAADRVLSVQLPDGGWPWLYDAETGRVVERYELYSVHQHAMAPMALLELSEATAEPRYAEAARRGLEWIYGRNELALPMIDEGERMIFRSIRRRRRWDRALLYANTASARTVGRPVAGTDARAELNATCRPYELGWLCEAWAGREALPDSATR